MADRIRIDMTHREFAWTALSILFIGILWGWALFGDPQIFNAALTDSNGADWIAAAGTWVIGYGAWKYARASHDHNVSLANRARAAEIRKRIAALAEVRSAAIRLAGIKSLLSDQLDGMSADSSIQLMIDTVASVTEKIQWSDSCKGYLDDRLVSMVASCELARDTFVVVMTNKAWNQLENVYIDSDEGKYLRGLLEGMATTVDGSAERLKNAALEERGGALVELNELQGCA